jgi:acyl dehydratase
METQEIKTAIEIGTPLPTVTKTMTQRKIDIYSGVHVGSLHSDQEFARKKGLKDTIAQGMMSAAYCTEILLRFFGKGYMEGGKLSVKFISPVYPGDIITAKGVITGKQVQAEGIRYEAEVWCENQEGEKVTVGTASAFVPG